MARTESKVTNGDAVKRATEHVEELRNEYKSYHSFRIATTLCDSLAAISRISRTHDHGRRWRRPIHQTSQRYGLSAEHHRTVPGAAIFMHNRNIVHMTSSSKICAGMAGDCSSTLNYLRFKAMKGVDSALWSKAYCCPETALRPTTDSKRMPGRSGSCSCGWGRCRFWSRARPATPSSSKRSRKYKALRRNGSYRSLPRRRDECSNSHKSSSI